MLAFSAPCDNTSGALCGTSKLAWSEPEISAQVIEGTVVVKQMCFVSDSAIDNLSFNFGDDCEDRDYGYCARRPELDSLIEVVQLTRGACCRLAGRSNSHLFLRFPQIRLMENIREHCMFVMARERLRVRYLSTFRLMKVRQQRYQKV